VRVAVEPFVQLTVFVRDLPADGLARVSNNRFVDNIAGGGLSVAPSHCPSDEEQGSGEK
jgi:hypothetical protein